MKYVDLSGLNDIRKEVLQTAKIDLISTRLCKTLAVLIYDKTKRRISETTLKRLYSFAERNFQPSNYTLDTLARYCNQSDWISWQSKLNIDLSAHSSPYMESMDFNKLFYMSPQPMWIFNPTDLRFLDVNSAAVQNYGYSKDEFLAMTILDIRPQEDLDLIRRVVHISNDECHHALTFRHLLANAAVIPVEIMTYALDLPQGTMRLVVPLRNG